MIIYNITTQVSWPAHEQWKKWMMDERLPEMIDTGIFSRYQLVRVLEVDDSEGPMYAVQLYVNELSSISEYKEKYMQQMEHVEKKLWGSQIYSFSSLMEVIN